ncbi:9-O-acetylesterase [Luteolibacter sp. LG18]|nr:9-O-acetylesterase [Luteolibacter sp. LG18]
MVLQQGADIPVWGWAAPGEKVWVSLAGNQKAATADTAGNWQVRFSPMKITREPVTLTVKGDNTVEFTDVLIGEVWLASGQSNMEFGIQKDADGPENIRSATDPQIRMFFVPWATALEPQSNLAATPPDSLNGKWQICSPQVMSAQWAWNGFSAVGYYFARDLRKATGLPVGMIASYKGGTPAEAWTSVGGLKQDPTLAHHVEEHEKLVAEYPAKNAAFPALKAEADRQRKAAESEWKQAVEQAKAGGMPEPKRPQIPNPPEPNGGFSGPGNNFNAMISPLIPYAIKGVIWYQGESNADNMEEAKEYVRLFPRLITDWREHWAQGDFPFLYVQLASFKPHPPTAVEEAPWPVLREAQLKTLRLPKTGMASAVDVGDANDIHPVHKRSVGERLAMAARQIAYGEQTVAAGPMYEAMERTGDQIRISFKKQPGNQPTIGVPPWIAGGSKPLPTTSLMGFAIAGEDRKFVAADARIQGDSIILSSPEVKLPVAVRYNWATNPSGNLYNPEGLPASPFRTDDW